MKIDISEVEKYTTAEPDPSNMFGYAFESWCDQTIDKMDESILDEYEDDIDTYEFDDVLERLYEKMYLRELETDYLYCAKILERYLKINL